MTSSSILLSGRADTEVMWRRECCIQEAIPNNSHLGLAVHNFQLSLTPAHLVTLVLVFFTKFCWCPPCLDLLYLLPDWALSWAPHRDLPHTFVMACCAICHINPQFTPCLSPSLYSPHPKYPTPHTSSCPAACSTYAMPELPKTEITKAPKYWLPKTCFQVHLRVTPKIKKCC